MAMKFRYLSGIPDENIFNNFNLGWEPGLFGIFSILILLILVVVATTSVRVDTAVVSAVVTAVYEVWAIGYLLGVVLLLSGHPEGCSLALAPKLVLWSCGLSSWWTEATQCGIEIDDSWWHVMRTSYSYLESFSLSWQIESPHHCMIAFGSICQDNCQQEIGKCRLTPLTFRCFLIWCICFETNGNKMIEECYSKNDKRYFLSSQCV